jgi:CHAT domain-containing protein
MRPATVSGEAPAHVPLGEVAMIRYEIEAVTTPVTDGETLQVDLEPETTVRVVLMIQRDAAEIVGARIHEVDALTVRQVCHLARHPLVFLNACESGRIEPSLTTWGGWPSAFLKAGAGAFVGISWPVHEKPAAAFTEVFYEAVLDGETLSDAATAARSAIKDMGDASWLAYKVYGHPFARRSSP